MQNRKWIWRISIYVAGLMVMSLGVLLNTKTGLGVSAPAAISYSISQAFGLNFSVMVCVVYSVYILLQFLIKGKNRQWRDLLQLPVNIVFSSFLNWFGTVFSIQFDALWQNILLMAVAIVLSGCGLAMMVLMKIVPNPPDGLTYTISEVTKKVMGLVKNAQDAALVIIAIAIDLVFSKKMVSIGIGTVLATIFTGRVVWLFNSLFKEKVQRLAGVS